MESHRQPDEFAASPGRRKRVGRGRWRHRPRCRCLAFCPAVGRSRPLVGIQHSGPECAMTNVAVQTRENTEPAWTLVRALLVLLVCVASVAPYAGADIAITLTAAALSLAALRLPARYTSGLRPALLLSLAATCVLSMTWSVAPFSTLPSAVAVLAMTVAVILVCPVSSRRDFLLAVSAAFRVVLIVTVLVAVAVPSVGLVDENYQTGALKGLFVHRNLLAFMALIALVTFLVVRHHRSRAISTFDIGLSVVVSEGLSLKRSSYLRSQRRWSC